MTKIDLDLYKKQLEINELISRPNLDQIKSHLIGVIEYGKFITQSLFVINGAGLGSFPIINSLIGPGLKLDQNWIIIAGSFFLLGAVFSIGVALFAYWNFSNNTQLAYTQWFNSSSQFNGSIGMPQQEIESVEKYKNKSMWALRAAHIAGWLSLIAFCFGVFFLTKALPVKLFC